MLTPWHQPTAFNQSLQGGPRVLLCFVTVPGDSNVQLGSQAAVLYQAIAFPLPATSLTC